MKQFFLYGCVILGWFSCSPGMPAEGSVTETMDQVVSRFYRDFTPTQLDTISHDFILHYLSEEEKSSFGTRFWNFEINVPATVSVMRDTDQTTVPFWLEEAGFKKTDLEVKNTHSVYEVWQKNHEAGRVDLGINGFDKHRPVYFVSVGPIDIKDSLGIAAVFPDHQHYQTMEAGSFTYHDWDGLTLTDVPESLQGQILLSTIRGRAREAHLEDAFRETKFPSSESPDQILLTWSADPASTMDIQWRSDTSVEKGMLRHWIKGGRDTVETLADKNMMEDRLLHNDRYINRFTAKLTDLEPGTSYEYQVSNDGKFFSGINTFTTAEAAPSSFSFLWTGDVHNSDIWGNMMLKALDEHPTSGFFMAAGDLVNTGLHRDDWDELFHYPAGVFASIPFMAVPGNHDSQDGLGAWMYKEMFSYPENGPTKEMAELTYSFAYQNALFLMIDATLPTAEQTGWIEEQLASSEANWKFAVFHFPPYNSIGFYQEIIDEWGPLFDQYHVDMVISGHFHYYLRTKPINNGAVVATPAEGTIYLMSVGTTGKNKEMKPADYAEIQFGGDHLYQHVEISGHSLRYTSYGMGGEVKDSLVIKK